jgi:thiol:disulfide interchange protein
MLPKPGRWMETFRKLMAVPMGLTALALLWLTWRLGGIWFALLSLSLVVLVVDEFRRSTRQVHDKGALSKPSLIRFAILLLIGVSVTSRFYDPQHAAANEGVIPAKPFSETTLAQARASGQPVFVWFTADGCLTCKVNESVAIEREATRDAFRKAGVIAIEGDWTRRDPAITQFLTAHGAAGVPLYLWYPPKGEARQLPQVLTPDSLVELAEESQKSA